MFNFSDNMEAPRIQINRPACTQSGLDKAFKLKPPAAVPVGQKIKLALRRPRMQSIGFWLLSFFPFILHLKKYR